jgi:hypothetical protein
VYTVGHDLQFPPGRSPSRLGERARAAMRLRHLSPRTEKAYVHWMRRFWEYHGRQDPAKLGPEEVSAFLSVLATRGRVSASQRRHELG